MKSHSPGKLLSLSGSPYVQWTLGLITFSFIFIYHTFPLGLSDFWWHLNTARWMWEHGSLPSADPFLYSSTVPLDSRASLILRGYPLSQLLMFGIYSLGGAQALLLFKGALMALFYGLLWNLLRRNGLHAILAWAVVALLPLLFFRFDELRPQVFSFIGALLALHLAEHIVSSGRQGKPLQWYVLPGLPLLMLLWANLHRGFIIGVGILLVYLFAEWLARRRGDDAMADAAFRRFLIATLVAIAASLINPEGVTAFWASFSEVSGPFSRVIDEYLGTLKYFEFIGMKTTGYLIVAVAVIPCLALLFKWRSLDLAHLLLAGFFLAAGMLSFRFSLMMVVVVLVIAAIYFAPELNRWLSLGKGMPIILLWCLATGVLANYALARTSLGKSPLENGVIPTAAIDYLAQANLQGNIYNPFECGGYLSWRLYPKKIFIDQRNLSWDTYEEYSRVWRGNYADVFRKYQIGVVFYPIYDGSSGGTSRLVAGLLSNRLWEVGYYDGRDIVLIRSDLNGYRYYLDKQAVVNDIVKHLRGG